jgi:integrase
MTTHNANNERTKRRYFAYLKEAKRNSESTVDAAAKALARFEIDTKYRDFRSFHFQQAIAFKHHLTQQTSEHTGEKLSKATLHSTLASVKAFFHWLAGQPGYKSHFQYSDADYFNLSEKDVRVATAKREQVGPTLEQARHVIGLMPSGTAIERRDRALIAFTLLTGARDSAIASMKLKHVNLVAGYVDQDAREVKTKFSKTFNTYFFPVGDEVRQIVVQWVAFLRKDLLWGNDDPLFPATRIALGALRQFEAVGLERSHWSSAARIRAIFRDAFTGAGLPYFNPHSFRNTLVRLGMEVCKTPEEFKAWSQNLGHDKVLTTFLGYGHVEGPRQEAIIRGLGAPQDGVAALPTNLDELVRALALAMQRDSHQGGSFKSGDQA